MARKVRKQQFIDYAKLCGYCKGRPEKPDPKCPYCKGRPVEE